MKEQYRSRVYTDRPPYADFESPAKFEAIKSIIAKRLVEHPNAICSYSGGSDSDILLHLIEQVRKTFDLPLRYSYEKRPHRFDRLREDNPQEWHYWMYECCTDSSGVKYGWGRVLDYIGVPWEDVPDKSEQLTLFEEECQE